MKKLLSLFLGAFSLAASAQQAGLSPLTRQMLQDRAKQDSKTYISEQAVARRLQNGQLCLSGMIRVSDAALAESGLRNLGVHTGTKAGRIWTVQVPVAQLEQFVALPGLNYIQMDEPVFPQLDVARKTTRVDSVHAGYGLPMPYTGKGVLLGVMDFGFDYTHPSFYDTNGTKYRILKAWELNGTGTPPAGYTYGRELADSNAVRAAGTDNPKQFHGTSVTGMAAGSGFGSTPARNRFRGMAFESDIVMVGVRRDSIERQWRQSGFSDFLDGIGYLFRYAGTAGKPMVVNVSWGSQSGPHDGTSLFNEACDQLTGRGKILVMSAGNEGGENIHLSKSFSASDSTLNTFLKFTSEAYKRTWVDVWGDSGKTFCAKITLYHNGVAGNSTGYICLDNQIHNLSLLGSNGTDSCLISVINATREFNGRPRSILDIYEKAGDSVGISIKAVEGKVQLWNEYYYYGYKYHYQSSFDSLNNPAAVSGNTVTTVSDMGAGDSVLLVGAYNSKVSFTNIANQTYGYNATTGAIAGFSSRGPMADGRVKPDIAGPGLTICTSVSSFDTSYTPTGTNNASVIRKTNFNGKDYYYAEFAGTSASSPAVAGIVALLLQIDSTLTPSRVKDLLFTTAIKDSYTGQLTAAGNNTWGHGKVNAYRAAKALLATTGVYTLKGNSPDCLVFPNPSRGSFTVSFEGAAAGQARVRVTSLSGAVVLEREWKLQNGGNQLGIDMSGKASGFYFVTVQTAEGSTTMKVQLQ